MIPFRGTRLFELSKEQGDSLEEKLIAFSFYDTDVNVSAVESETLAKIFRRANWKVYVQSPFRLLKLFWLLPNKLTHLPYAIKYLLHRLFAKPTA